MSTLHKRHIPPQLRLLAPKSSLSHSVSPVQQLERHNIWDEQDTEAPPTATTNVKLQHPATLQLYIPSVPNSGHDLTSPPLLSPDATVSSLEGKQDEVVAPCTNIYSSRVPLPPANDSLPELARGNLFPGARAATSESYGLSTQHPSYDNLQLQETTQNRQGQDYGIPTLGTPEVWTAMVQPTMGDHQNQSSQPTADQHLHMSIQPLSAVQPAYHAPLQQNSQHAACVNCPTIWRSHLESIMLSDPEDKGMSSLKRTYQQLQQHIYEAHQWHYGTGCALCENFVCYHLGKMMLLEAAEGNFAHARIDLGNSFMMLREHIQEAHGGC